MNRVSYSSTDVNTPLLDTDRLLLDAQYIDLKETYDNPQEIYTLLVAYNASLNIPQSQEVLLEYAHDLKLPTDQGPHEPREDTTSLYNQAINEKDRDKLYVCVEMLATLKRLSPLQFSLKKDEIREAFGKRLNWIDFQRAINHAERRQTLAESGTKPSVADIAQHWVMEHRDSWAYDQAAQCWRMWNGEYWQEVEEKGSELDQYVVAALQESGIPVNSSNVMNTFQRIAAGHCKRTFIQVEGKINFANGTLDVSTMQLHTYRKEDNFTYCLPYNYNPQRAHPNITSFLLGLIQERCEDQFIPNIHGVQAIMAHIGLALLGDIRLHKAITALGVTGSGKSTLLDLANETCGITAKKYVPHDVFSRELEGKRARYSHGKKRIACLDEVPADALQEEELFKAITAHSGVSVRGLNRDEQVDNQWRPKVLMVANDDPHYRDISGAIKRRLIVIRTPIQRYDEPKTGQPGQNALLLDSLLPELEGFAATCIRYALEVRKRGYYPQSATMKHDLDQIANNGNPLKSCIEEKFILNASAHTCTEDLHKVYVEYCLELGANIHAFAKPKFSSALIGMNIGISPKRMADGKGGLVGIRLRTDFDPTPTDDTTNYTDSPLLDAVDSTLDAILDGQRRLLTAEISSRQAYESTPQADVLEPLTAATADLENNIFFESVCVSSERDTHTFRRKKENEFLPSQPSNGAINGHVKPLHSTDGWENQPSIAANQPSKPSKWTETDESGFFKYCQVPLCGLTNVMGDAGRCKQHRNVEL